MVYNIQIILKLIFFYLDDALLTHKDGKIFLSKFEKLEKEISDIRKMMEASEMAIASNYTHHKDFINVSNLFIKFLFKQIFTYLKYFEIGTRPGDC